MAYILGTARHESRLRSIEERRASSSQVEVYQNQNRYWLDGYYGRGLVQLTWERNYIKMTKLLNVDFVSKPHLALVPSYSARILVQGMMEGSFTRKKLDTYINEQEQDFYKARKTVNGTDRADRIKGYTLSVLENL